MTPNCGSGTADSHAPIHRCLPSQLTWTHLATDGTLFPLVTNSMYQPGGAMLWLLVRFRLTVLPEPEIGNSTNRWFGSDWWVTAAGLISSAVLIGVLVVMV